MFSFCDRAVAQEFLAVTRVHVQQVQVFHPHLSCMVSQCPGDAVDRLSLQAFLLHIPSTKL